MISTFDGASLSALLKAGFSEQAIVDAMVKANGDRARLARLRRAGKVRRVEGTYEARHPEITRPFVRSIEGLANSKAGVNLAIRPKKKRR